jgi:plasmid stabilization system protein ParE
MEKRIVYTKNFKNSLKVIFQFYSAATNPIIAENIINRIISKLEVLITEPYIGQIDVQKREFKDREIRRLVYSHFKIYYKVAENQIIILFVFDTRQNPDKLKF